MHVVRNGIFLTVLGLEYYCVLVGANNTTASSDATPSPSTAIDDDDTRRHHHHPVGGLYWRDLGVSLANCPWTTAQMLDKYDNESEAEAPSRDGAASSDTGRDWQCIDDSTWLLHPSSGFVENGSLCGILGPRWAFLFSFLVLYYACSIVKWES